MLARTQAREPASDHTRQPFAQEAVAIRLRRVGARERRDGAYFLPARRRIVVRLSASADAPGDGRGIGYRFVAAAYRRLRNGSDRLMQRGVRQEWRLQAVCIST